MSRRHLELVALRSRRAYGGYRLKALLLGTALAVLATLAAQG